MNINNYDNNHLRSNNNYFGHNLAADLGYYNFDCMNKYPVIQQNPYYVPTNYINRVQKSLILANADVP